MILKIKELREEFQLTQNDLATKILNSQRNISNWENGTSEPDCTTILKLADFFNVTLDELFGRNEAVASYGSLDSEQAELITLLRRLTKEQKEAVKNLILSFNL